MKDQIKGDFEEIIHVMRSSGRSYVKWSLALDQDRGPNLGGCHTCNPLVTVNTTSGAVTYDIEFYTLGHFSKFVLPGAYRIYSGNGAGLVSAAFLNPNQSKALVVFNESSVSKTFAVQWGDKQFQYTLAGLAGATFTWTGSLAGQSFLNATDRINASSFSSVSGLQTENCSDSLNGHDLGSADNGDYACYKSFNFSSPIRSVTARVASGGAGGTLEFRLGGASGSLLGSVRIPGTDGWQNWTNVTGSISAANGVADLYLVFKGGRNIGNLNWFQFGAMTPR